MARSTKQQTLDITKSHCSGAIPENLKECLTDCDRWQPLNNLQGAIALEPFGDRAVMVSDRLTVKGGSHNRPPSKHVNLSFKESETHLTVDSK